MRILTRHAERAPDLVTAVIGDITADTPMADAVDGVDAIIHCATDPGDHRSIDGRATARLAEFALRAGSPHVVYPGIVGSDVVPCSYYQSKMSAEASLTASGLPVSIVRATQFHQFIWWKLGRAGRFPLVPVPRDTRLQPIDPRDFARILVDRVEHGPSADIHAVGGPNVYEAHDLAKSHRAATGGRARLIRVNYPGIRGAALRAGALITPNRVEGGRTWNEFVASRIESR